MTDLELLKYMEESHVDLAFKEKDNYYSFLIFLHDNKKLSEPLFNNFARKFWHHITFYDTDLRYSKFIMHGDCANRNKTLVYYEDITNKPLVVELL